MGGLDYLSFFIPGLNIDLIDRTDVLLQLPEGLAYKYNDLHYAEYDPENVQLRCSRIVQNKVQPIDCTYTTKKTNTNEDIGIQDMEQITKIVLKDFCWSSMPCLSDTPIQFQFELINPQTSAKINGLIDIQFL